MDPADGPSRKTRTSPTSTSRSASRTSRTRKSNPSRRSGNALRSSRPQRPSQRRSLRNRRDDYSVSSGSSYSEDTEANSEAKLQDRGLVVNASDLSECWSKTSLNSDEETAFQRFTKKYEARKGVFYFGNEDDLSLPSIETSRPGSRTHASMASSFRDSVDETYDDFTVASDDSGIVKRTETYRTEAVEEKMWYCGLDDDSITDERSYGGLRNNEVLIAAASSMKTYDTRGADYEEESREPRQDTRAGSVRQKKSKSTKPKSSQEIPQKEVPKKEVPPMVENGTIEETPEKTEMSLFSSILPAQWWFGSGSTTNEQQKEEEKKGQQRIENAKRDLLVKPNVVVERTPSSSGSNFQLNARVRNDISNTVDLSAQVDLNGRVKAFPKKNVRQARRESMKRAARLKIPPKDQSMSLAIATGASKAMRSQYALKEEGVDGAFVGSAPEQKRSDGQGNRRHRTKEIKKEARATIRGSVLSLQVEESSAFVPVQHPGTDTAAVTDYQDVVEPPVFPPVSVPLKSTTVNQCRSHHRKASIHDDIQETAFYTVWSAPTPTGSMLPSDHSHAESVQTPKWITEPAPTHDQNTVEEYPQQIPMSKVQSLISTFEHTTRSERSKVEVNAAVRPEAIPSSSSNHVDADCNVSISSASASLATPTMDDDIRNEATMIKIGRTGEDETRDAPADQSFHSQLLYLGSTDHESLQPKRQERRRESGRRRNSNRNKKYYGEITTEALQPRSYSSRRPTSSSSSSRRRQQAKNTKSSHTRQSSTAESSISTKLMRELDELGSKATSLGSSVDDSFVQGVLHSINGDILLAAKEQESHQMIARGADSFFDALEESVSVD